MSEQKNPYEAPAVEEIAGGDYPISTAAGNSDIT